MIDLYEVEQDHDGQTLKIELAVEQSLSITVSRPANSVPDLDEKTAHAVAKQFLDDKLRRNPSQGTQAWWEFHDTHRINYQMVNVVFLLEPLHLPKSTHSSLPYPPETYVHITECGDF